MRRSFRPAHLLLCGAIALPAAAAFPSEGPPKGEQAEIGSAIQVLDAWIQATLIAKEEPGLSIAIVHDQDVLWAKGYGFADRDKHVAAGPTTLYRIASVSKLFTAMALMQLRDEGRLQLDDPVSKHLAWFKVRSAASDSPAITIRHLLTHTSGLPRELPLYYWNDLAFPSLEEMIRLVGSQETVFPPETEWKYSNLALAIAGEVTAEVAGEPYERYVERRILSPLGMSSTLVSPRPQTPSLAIGYRRRVSGASREAEDFIDARALTPAANIASSVLDLAKLVSLQMRSGPAGGAQILKGSTLREMHRVQWLRPDWQSGQGLGFWLRRVGTDSLVGHDGAAPGYRAQLDFSPSGKLGVIVLSNAYDADTRAYVDQAFAIVGPAVAKATLIASAPPVPDPAWQSYVGTYSWKHADVQVLILNDGLALIVPDATNPWESRVRLTPIGPDRFRMVGGSASGEQLRFERDAAGHVTRLVAGSYYRLRVLPEKAP